MPRRRLTSQAQRVRVESDVLAAHSTPIEPFYLSADSAPEQFAVRRPAWLAPAFIVLFGALCAALVPLLPRLMDWYASLLAALTGVPTWQILGKGGSLSFRPFMALLMVLLCLFAAAPLAERLKMLGVAWAVYATGILLIDVTFTLGDRSWAPSSFSPVAGLLSGLIGLLAIVVTVLMRARLPAGVRVDTRLRGRRRNGVVLAVSGVIAVALLAAFAFAREEYFDGLHIRFIGGLDSNIVLFLLAIMTLLFVASWFRLERKPTVGEPMTVAFLIPACNEAPEIAETLEAIDVAAATYPARCKAYVVENGSHDDTARAAELALRRCRYLEGVVLRCTAPGKGRALNLGLLEIVEDVVVRIDADTLVPPSLLHHVMPWFWDPEVGGVSGMPLPKPSTPRWLYPLRIIEVVYGVAFLRVAQGGADATMVMPGLLAAYRRELVGELGGFGEGFNGEDADITMRIGRLGYRIVTDPAVRVQTEVPKTLAHLREQRQRWARGLWHMAARNLSCIWMRQGARGLWVLPWSIFNGARRSLMIPILTCALVVELLEPAVLSLREVSVVAGFIVGLQLIIITLLLVAHRQFRALPFVPAYLLFRMFRAYTGFETLLTLRLKPSGGTAAPGMARAFPSLRTATREET